ncbi:MAG: hypothetical protein ACHQIL_03335 [Steroidobacterales bacterium]
MLRRTAAFAAAVSVMVVLGSAAHSYLVQQAWSMAAGWAEGTDQVGIPLAERMTWAAHDLVGMIRSYGVLVSIALFIAFLAAGALARFTGHRTIVFGASGAAAIFVMFTALRTLQGTVFIFGARGTTGLAAQMAVGLIAAIAFAQLTASLGAGSLARDPVNG